MPMAFSSCVYFGRCSDVLYSFGLIRFGSKHTIPLAITLFYHSQLLFSIFYRIKSTECELELILCSAKILFMISIVRLTNSESRKITHTHTRASLCTHTNQLDVSCFNHFFSELRTKKISSQRMNDERKPKHFWSKLESMA